MAFLVGVYFAPLEIRQDIGSQNISIEGLQGAENNGRFSYAYTDGDTFITFPQTGVGRFVLRLRMGGPHGTVPLRARVTAATEQIDLGSVASLRVYHLLAPTNHHGDVQLRIQSTTTVEKGDRRALGVLLDWLELETLGNLSPPPSLLLSTPFIFLLFWIAIIQIQTPYRWKIVLMLFCSAALGISYALGRGKIALEWWGVIAAGISMAYVSLTHFDRWNFASPFTSITALFIVWRTTLWFISGMGTWYSSTFYQYGKKIASAGAIIDRQHFLWRFLVDAWVGWDGAYYRGIAVDGYSFTENGPYNIAFFPLYPLLTRLFLPISNSNTSIAALLVSHIAIFSALILMYDLVARDFGSTAAKRALVLLLVFPTSFYFVTAYSEALALALFVASLWAMRQGRWWIAGVTGALLALTRLPGVLIAPVLACAYLQHNGWRLRSIRPDFLSVLLPPCGLGLFMSYQWWRFGTPFAFLIAQRHWDNHLEPPWIMPHILLTTVTTASDWPMRVLQLVIWISFIVLIVFAFIRLHLPYGLSLLLLLLPAYLSHWHSSFPRYVLIGFPAFVVMAVLARRRWLYLLVVSLMLSALTIDILLFINGFWVA